MTGPSVIADPEEIEQFARDLDSFNDVLSENLSRLHSQFGGLSVLWRDQEHERFAAEFEQTVRALHHFMRESEQQVPFLRRKAQHLRAYRDQR
jgi:uncharacterized protein YukE